VSRAEEANIEAADWLIARAEGPLSAEDQIRFDAWLASSDGNKAAFWRLEYGWETADRVASLGLPPIDCTPEPKRAVPARWWVPCAMAASIAMAFLLHTLAAPRAGPPPRARAPEIASQAYATPVGGRRLVGLADGSRIQLNTQSRLHTEISTARREVWLDQGEAFFEVAHRDDQPFIVHAGDRQIVVLGTKFSVRRDGDKVVVAVIEGRVRVDELRGNVPARSSVITGGDIALAAEGATLVTARSQDKVEDLLAWREGMLSFDEEPLRSIATEFNRYNDRKVVIDGQDVGAIRITGTFPVAKPDAFTRLLRDAFGLEISETASEIRVSRRSPASDPSGRAAHTAS